MYYVIYCKVDNALNPYDHPGVIVAYRGNSRRKAKRAVESAPVGYVADNISALIGAGGSTMETMKTGAMTAQVLYDLRALTGFISGEELHDLFAGLCGDPSPSGRILIGVTEAAHAFAAFRAMLDKSLSQVGELMDYAGISDQWEPMPGDPTLGDALLENPSATADWLAACVRHADEREQ